MFVIEADMVGVPQMNSNKLTNEPRHEKTNVLACDLVRHKQGCTATEIGQRLEMSDLERGIVLSM